LGRVGLSDLEATPAQMATTERAADQDLLECGEPPVQRLKSPARGACPDQQVAWESKAPPDQEVFREPQALPVETVSMERLERSVDEDRLAFAVLLV